MASIFGVARAWLPVALALWVLAANSSPAGAPAGPALRARPFRLTDEDRTWWAFRPVTRPVVDTTSDATHPVDALLLARLREQGLSMNPPASPREQVRRLSFDLTGLPPAPEDVDAFERSPTDAAWDALVERLLASPGYGERWGRHWLDLVRYAESNGYERDGPKPNAWRYRDYVIQAFARDKPFDRFVREQMAGDELAEAMAAAGGEGSDAWREAIVATGFYRLHVWDDEPDSTLAAEFDDLDDMLVTTGTAFLGLTIGCARCHDHKFDPVSQPEYYSLLAFIRSVEPYGRHHTGGGGRGTGRIERVLATGAELRLWEERRRESVRKAEERLAAATQAGEREARERELRSAREERPPFDHALAVAEEGALPKPTRVFARGDVHSPREEVFPAFPAVFGLPAPNLPERAAGSTTSGRRRVLADWVANPANPLTARVWANRVWQHLFGAGLVATPDDFGRTGMPPTHPELLDHLASELVARGWRTKSLIRQVVASHAYRMSSSAARPDAVRLDEANRLWWRQNVRRLEAESIRDTILAVSGRLQTKAGGPSVFPTLPAEVHGTQDSAGKGWTDSPASEQDRRSVYLVVKRALRVPLLECFDTANSTSGSGARSVTTTAPQALMLLNDAWVRSVGATLAERVVRESGEAAGEAERIGRLYALAYQRAPSARELALARDFLDRQRRGLEAEGRSDAAPESWRSLCRAVLNTSELIYVE